MSVLCACGSFNGHSRHQADIALNNETDSLSYAMGRSDRYSGLRSYTYNVLGVDSAYSAAVVRGIKEGALKEGDKEFDAYVAGIGIYKFIHSRKFPGLNDYFPSDSLDETLFLSGVVASLCNDSLIMGTAEADSVSYSITGRFISRDTEAYKAKNAAFLFENQLCPDVQVTPSGLQYRVLKCGEGKCVKTEDTVKVSYVGSTIDGRIFEDSSAASPDGVYLDVLDLIPGWAEALKLMNKGAKFEIFIPSYLGYVTAH